MTIAVDFDGTCVTHEYPRIGKDIGAFPVLRRLVGSGHDLILYTMRSGIEAKQAADFLASQGIRLYSVNRNPTQDKWTDSPKVYAHLYIDDAGLGIPLKKPKKARPYVDWKKVEKLLEKRTILPPSETTT